MSADIPGRERLLSDADVAALVDALEKKVVQRFYTNIGKGIWSVAWKGFIVALLAICAYGAGKGWHN